jgi:hypothetical protein
LTRVFDYPEFPEEGVGHLDDLGVDGRVLLAEDLDVDLMELAVAALLGLVVAEHGAHVVVAHGRALEVEPVLHDGPDDRGGVLRPEGQGPPALVGERVHLFGDDVGGRARPLLEELGGLEDGGPELPEVVELESLPGQALEGLPLLDLAGEDVLGPPDGGELLLGRKVFAHRSSKTPSLRIFL